MRKKSFKERKKKDVTFLHVKNKEESQFSSLFHNLFKHH